MDILPYLWNGREGGAWEMREWDGIGTVANCVIIFVLSFLFRQESEIQLTSKMPFKFSVLFNSL